jgi:hypothetical protein
MKSSDISVDVVCCIAEQLNFDSHSKDNLDIMDIDELALRQIFEEWATRKNYPKELWPVLWDAYLKGVYDAPSPYDFPILP